MAAGGAQNGGPPAPLSAFPPFPGARLLPHQRRPAARAPMAAPCSLRRRRSSGQAPPTPRRLSPPWPPLTGGAGAGALGAANRERPRREELW